jgi:iron complex transport system ATP-binding protein
MIAGARVSVTLLDRVVVRDVDVTVARGAWLSLIGPNGAGKTTLLRALAGQVPAAGTLTIAGRPWASMPARRRARQVAVVPQQPERPSGMRVLDYVLLGRSPHLPYLGTERRDDVLIAHAQLERLDLVAFADRPVTTLSGGEFQRAVLARALAQQAPILLLDEPTSALDLGHAQQVLELVDELRRERGLTVVAALHDLTLAGQYADELMLLVDGRVVAKGPAVDVLTGENIGTHYHATVEVVRHERAGPVPIPYRRARPEGHATTEPGPPGGSLSAAGRRAGR